MLTLARKPGEGVLIDDGTIVVRVRKITATRVELAIECPREMRIVRGEVREGWLPQTQAARPAS